MNQKLDITSTKNGDPTRFNHPNTAHLAQKQSKPFKNIQKPSNNPKDIIESTHLSVFLPKTSSSSAPKDPAAPGAPQPHPPSTWPPSIRRTARPPDAAPEAARCNPWCHTDLATGAKLTEGCWMGCWGLLGLLIVSQWIIPENSLRLARTVIVFVTRKYELKGDLMTWFWSGTEAKLVERTGLSYVFCVV